MTERDRIDLDQLRRDIAAGERDLNRVTWGGLFVLAVLAAWLLCLVV